MRRTALAISIVGLAIVVNVGGVAVAEVSGTQQLPAAACNDGTMNAHANVPESTGNGAGVFAHHAIPGAMDGGPCGHGG